MKVWDAYRPVNAQRRFWELLPDNRFVAYPPDMETLTCFKNSHMNGQCVDVTLCDSQGCELVMPSGFDDFTKKARLDCPETTGEARKNAEYLRTSDRGGSRPTAASGGISTTEKPLPFPIPILFFNRILSRIRSAGLFSRDAPSALRRPAGRPFSFAPSVCPPYSCPEI